jgi:hypothetical protein
MSFASALIQPGQWPYIAPIILLFCSNLFMTLAWYGHLKFKAVSLVVVVLVSWGDLLRRALKLDASRRFRLNRAWRRSRVSWPSLKGLRRPTSPDGRGRPEDRAGPIRP